MKRNCEQPLAKKKKGKMLIGCIFPWLLSCANARAFPNSSIMHGNDWSKIHQHALEIFKKILLESTEKLSCSEVWTLSSSDATANTWFANHNSFSLLEKSKLTRTLYSKQHQEVKPIPGTLSYIFLNRSIRPTKLDTWLAASHNKKNSLTQDFISYKSRRFSVLSPTDYIMHL